MNQAEPTTSKPWPIYIIFGSVALILISGLLFSPKSEEAKLKWIETLGTTNNGILLNPPLEVLAGQLVNLDKTPWTPLDDTTWKMFVLAPDQCAQQCIDRLEELHAMRIRLHRDAGRLTIALLTTTAQQLPADVLQFHDLNQVLISDEQVLLSLVETNMPSTEQSPVVLLMNPIDVIMMAYDQSKIGSEILADFEHLLDLAH